MRLLNEYQATIKYARMEGYRQQQLGVQALTRMSEMLAQARTAGEQMIRREITDADHGWLFARFVTRLGGKP